MKLQGRRLLAAVLTIAMMLSLMAIPAAAEVTTTTTYDFQGDEFRGCGVGTSAGEFTWTTDTGNVTGTSAFIQSGNGYGVLLNNGGSLTLPVTGNCDITVTYKQRSNLKLGDQAAGKDLGSGDTATAIVRYKDWAEGTDSVTLTSTGGQSYILSIAIGPLTVPAPELSLTPESVSVKMGETDTVTATVANATMGEVTATSRNTGIAEASVEGGTITITPVAVGDTEVDVSVAISDAENGSTDALTATIPVKVEAAGLTTSWDLNDSAASVLGTSGGTWKGLTVSGSPRYAGGANGVQLGAGSTFTFPVAGNCDIKVTGSWKWDVYLGGAEDFHVTEADGNPGILYYRGEAGNVTLYSGNNNCYITKIEVVANSDPAPAALVLDKSAVTLKMDGTTTAEVNAKVRTATGAVTATPEDDTVVSATVADKKITLTALKDGKTNVNVTVEGTELTKTIAVTVEPAGEVVYDTWDFTASDWTAEEKVKIQKGTPKETGTLRGLEIDATGGGVAKFDGSQLGTSWVQFNQDTIIKVPVKVPDGKKALVSVKAYAANTISVDGVPNQKANEVEQFVCAGTNDFVTIKGLGGQGYLASIKVEYGEGELTPVLDINKNYLGLEMGKTQSGEITVTRINSTATVKAVSKDETVATAAVSGDKVTITAVGAGETTVDISLDGVTENELTKKTVTVEVAAAGQVFYIEEGTYDFAGYTADNIGSIKGLDTHGAIPQAASPSHGLQESGAGAGTSGTATGKIELTVNIPEGKTADLIFVTCRFGIGTALLMESTSGTVTKAEAEVDSATGLQYTVAGASGETTLTFHIPDGTDPDGNEWNKGIWIHSMTVLFGAQKEEDRKIDVWDLTGQEVSGEDYRNNITAQVWKDSGVAVNGVLSNGTEFTVGDFTLIHNANDRLYSGVDGAAGFGASATAGYGTWEFEDGYKPNGGVYCNGKGSATTRYMQVKNVFPGDKLVVYGGSAQTGAVTFNFEGLGGAASQPIESFTVPDAGSGKKMEFVAQATGTYKIWCSDPGKPMYQRVVRVPGVPVTGAITLPNDYNGPADYGIKFVNATTKAVTVAEVKNDQYTVTLAPGYEYNAIMTGARGWGFTVNTKKATTAEDGGVGVDALMTHNMTVEPKQTYTFSGSFVGFADGYDISKLAVDLIPEEGSGSDDTALEITGKTFTAILDPEVEYTLVLGGANDYVIKTPLTMKSDKDDVAQDITVEPKATYTVSGKFTGLGEDGTVTALDFENVDDKYTYPATVTADGYTISLRPGSYAAKATVEGKYATKTHVVVVDKAVEKDLMFVSTAAKPAVDKVKDVYVGYAAKTPNFDTVSAAMDAVSRMGIAAEADRVTVHIAPGTYREQIMVTTPYVTFINDEPAKGEVLLTWYYGIGYKYYSAGSPAEGGYYNAERAYDKFEKNIADRWGTAVRVTGKAFRAENITFENSFNRYITEEEIVDGVEIAGTGNSATVRQYGVDVTSKAATERAAAICVEADESEFYNCKFYSSQDTVYTQGKVYFKNCLIEGQTDYIFGDLASKCIFDACQLSWKGYSEGSMGGYITALRTNAGDVGYLFRNCAVTANPKLTVTAGNWGRPWGADANVFFLNTKLEKNGLIADKGWDEMSGAKPENAQFGEFGTTLVGGGAVDTSKRVTGTVKDQTYADEINQMSKYFGSWVPYYYVEEAATVAFEVEPTITDNGDINTPYPGHTLTVHYSLGEANDANDASLIQWIRVADDGTETVVKSTTAAVGKTYQIAKADQGAAIKVTVTPTTVSGKTGEAKSITMDNKVREGYEDPSGATDPELGDGVNIFLAGDSTVFDYKGRDEGSWGEFLQNYFNKDYVTVVDNAVGGRSCRSFINEGRLDTIAANISEGDFLLIQFGHNDCANEDAYRVERYAPLGTPDANGKYPSTAGTKDADGKYTWNCGGTYKWYLQQYIDVAKAHGATPILVTPVARLYYESDGTIRPHHDASLVPGTEETTKTTNSNKSDTYVAAVKQLAEENGIACIDGFEITKKLYEDAYKAAGNNTYGQQVMHSGDSTHSNKLGGMIQAAEIASALQNMDLTISKTVKAPAMAMGQTVKGQTVFSVNGEGKFTAYNMLTKPDPYAETAPYWMGIGQAKFDAIAAKAKELNGGDTPDEPADKTALTAAITAAEKKATDTHTVSDGTAASDVSRGTKFVTESDKAALTAAITAAKAVADKAGATDQEIAKALADLKTAVETFDKTIQTGTKGGNSGGRPSGGTSSSSSITTVTNPDGSVATIKKAANGDKTITVKSEGGETLAEVKLPATIPAAKTKFVDVPDEHWAAKSINNMAALGMVKGVTEDTFDMTSPMTRGAIATILFRLSNGKEGKSVTFADVAKDAWYADAVGWAAGAKLITGYDETTFGPDDTITRQQLAVMIARYARLLGLDTTADTGALNAFTDGSSTDTWATDAMAWCVKAGVMNGRGNGTVDPKTNVTRAEAAAMLDRMIGLLK